MKDIPNLSINQNCDRFSLYRGFFIWFAIFVIGWVGGSRVFGIDRDYYNYSSLYSQSRLEGDQQRIEFGFQVVKDFLRDSLNLSFEGFLIFTAVVCLGAKYLIFRGSRFVVVTFLFYLAIVFPLHEMTQIRVAMGTVFLYHAFQLIDKKNPLFAVGVFCLGVLFHNSIAVFIIPLLGVKLVNIQRRVWMIPVLPIIGAAIIKIGRFAAEEINPLTADYYEQGYDDYYRPNPFSARMLVFVLVMSCGLFNIKILQPNTTKWLALLGYGIGLFYFLIDIPVYSLRLFEITMFGGLILAAEFPTRIRGASIATISAFAVFNIYKAFYLDKMFYK